jgi:hypothetical protein
VTAGRRDGGFGSGTPGPGVEPSVSRVGSSGMESPSSPNIGACQSMPLGGSEDGKFPGSSDMGYAGEGGQSIGRLFGLEVCSFFFRRLAMSAS